MLAVTGSLEGSGENPHDSGTTESGVITVPGKIDDTVDPPNGVMLLTKPDRPWVWIRSSSFES